MLTGIQTVNQSGLKDLAKFAVTKGSHLMILGPSGGGKTEIFKQVCEENRYRYVYIDLSVLESPDLIGLPTISEDKKFVDYAAPRFLPLAENAMENETPFVLILDEIDKAKTEIQAPLLEILSEGSINGRKLNLQACLLTGNLPDEGAFSNPISHALTNRCMIYKLELAFDIWRDWAVNNAVHPLVVGFLSRHQEWLHQRPTSEDPTAYCYPTPRSWTLAARDLEKLGKSNYSFQSTLVSGRVGAGAATKFLVWLKYYQKLEPKIDALLKEGKTPSDLSFDETLVAALSAASLSVKEARSSSWKKTAKSLAHVHKKVDHVFSWLAELSTDLQLGAIKNSINNSDLQRLNLGNVESFVNTVLKVKAFEKEYLECKD